jgi:hypothetical protein
MPFQPSNRPIGQPFLAAQLHGLLARRSGRPACQQDDRSCQQNRSHLTHKALSFQESWCLFLWKRHLAAILSWLKATSTKNTLWGR